MIYNQIIKFLKNTPRSDGRKYDLFRGGVRDDPRATVSQLHPYFVKPGENHYTILDEKIGLKESHDAVGEFLRLCEGK